MVRVSEVRKPERCVPPSTVCDVVGETENRFRVSVVILQADFDVHVYLCRLHVDGLVVQNGLAAIEVLDEFDDAAGVLELGPLGFAGLGVGLALVGERDDQAFYLEIASSRRRCESVSKLYSVAVKIVLSGMKWTRVPRFLLAPLS